MTTILFAAVWIIVEAVFLRKTNLPKLAVKLIGTSFFLYIPALAILSLYFKPGQSHHAHHSITYIGYLIPLLFPFQIQLFEQISNSKYRNAFALFAVANVSSSYLFYALCMTNIFGK